MPDPQILAALGLPADATTEQVVKVLQDARNARSWAGEVDHIDFDRLLSGESIPLADVREMVELGNRLKRAMWIHTIPTVRHSDEKWRRLMAIAEERIRALEADNARLREDRLRWIETVHAIATKGLGLPDPWADGATDEVPPGWDNPGLLSDRVRRMREAIDTIPAGIMLMGGPPYRITLTEECVRAIHEATTTETLAPQAETVPGAQESADGTSGVRHEEAKIVPKADCKNCNGSGIVRFRSLEQETVYQCGCLGPAPRRMQANPLAHTAHMVEHDCGITCKEWGCIPVAKEGL